MKKIFDKARDAQLARDFAEAERLFRQLVRLNPKLLAAQHCLGEVLQSTGRLDEAEIAYRRALALSPASVETRYSLSQTIMGQGRYREALPFFRSRHQLPNLQTRKPALPFAEWEGEDLAGKSLLIWFEQGYGDELQYARFAPVLAALGVTVRLLCRPPVAALFRRSLTGVEVIEAAGPVDFPDPDVYAMGPDLAGLMDYTLETVPGGSYLVAGKPVVSGARIGLVTSGNPTHANNAMRSLNATDAARLAQILGATIDLDAAATGATTFAETADIIAGLDLVVTVDTAVAHLAGAMGKPVWILIPHLDTDWRWGRTTETSSWYASARLFRSAPDGDWTPAFERIAAALA